MPAQASHPQWYLARDGKQFGPLNEAELAKFVDLGHLLPSDLLWREGFPDWRPAMVVFPQYKPASLRSPPAPSGDKPGPSERRSFDRPFARSAVQREAEMDDEITEPDPKPRRSFRRFLTVAVLLIASGGALWAALNHRAELTKLVGSVTASLPTAALSSTSGNKGLEAAPFKGFHGTPESVDATLQHAALWQVMKRDFPDWYADQIKQATALAAQGKDDAEIGLHVARALVTLRRQQVKFALSASFPQLKMMASRFLESVDRLGKDSPAACFALIAQGEASPTIVSLLQGSPHTAHLQAQLTSVFTGIADGRKTPRVYPEVKREDFDLLATELKKIGWTQNDWQLFTTNLSSAAPEKACQLVHDWFSAQLGLKDENAQLRLLVETLRVTLSG